MAFDVFYIVLCAWEEGGGGGGGEGERGEERGRDRYESFQDGKEMVTQQLNLLQVCKVNSVQPLDILIPRLLDSAANTKQANSGQYSRHETRGRGGGGGGGGEGEGEGERGIAHRP